MFLEQAGSVIFDKTEIEVYYDRIGLAKNHRTYNVKAFSDGEALGHLDLLIKLHLINIPFENLSLHYSQNRTISLHPSILYGKIIKSKGRGGYCMENNTIFACLLRSLGYEIYSTGARIFGNEEYMGW